MLARLSRRLSDGTWDAYIPAVKVRDEVQAMREAERFAGGLSYRVELWIENVCDDPYKVIEQAALPFPGN